MWGDGFGVEDTVLALEELTDSSSLIPKRTLEFSNLFTSTVSFNSFYNPVENLWLGVCVHFCVSVCVCV